MSKKLKTRLILLAVLVIWGNIGYRIFKNYQVEQELEENTSSYQSSSVNIVNFRKDSFDLVLPDVDPFLKSRIKPNKVVAENTDKQSNNHSNNHHKKKVKKEKVVEETKWPQIKYLGFIRNHNNKDALCLLQINGNMLKVSKGDEEVGVFISNVFRDSIHVVYSGEERTFRKG